MALAMRAGGTLLLIGAVFLALTALAVSARPGDPEVAEQTIVVSPREAAAVAGTGTPVTGAGESILPLPGEDPVPISTPVIQPEVGVAPLNGVEAQPLPPPQGIPPPVLPIAPAELNGAGNPPSLEVGMEPPLQAGPGEPPSPPWVSPASS